MIYIVEEQLNLKAKLGVAIGFHSLSSIKSSDEILGCKLLSLHYIRLIGDEAPRLRHVACEEESPCDPVHLIGN